MTPTDAELLAGRLALARIDPLMAKAHTEVLPSTWIVRERGFKGLVRQIIGQQVSVAAADSIRRKMIEGLGSLSPETVLAADDVRLRGFGLSGQKVRYLRAIAEAAELFERLEALTDAEASAALIAIKGIGRWTAETYLMFSEGRLDFFPAGDIALQEGFRLLEGSEQRPTEKALYARAEMWKPYRGVAALLLWGYYMQAKGLATESGAVLSP
ncbi:DNA-3-methyladenine glycosylase 2 family protein [Aquabacter sp. CN5-332]|uniref:DNA-3-methyladenine glycosylase family protein n=1 Tax=Aquabacter sp. CN5-332 TaxID=3156608 RepID=UPI0032B40022